MTAQTPDRSYLCLVRIASVRRILLSLAVGRIAASMASVVMVVFALERFDSPAVAGVVVFAGTAPAVVMGPIAGALLDRHGRVRLVILDQLVGAAAVLLVAILAVADRLPVWLLIAIAAAASFTRPLSITGLRSVLPMIVPQHLWPRVNALDSNAFMVATLAGPAAAGVTISILGADGAQFAVAGLLLIAALVLLGVPEQAPGPISGRPLLADAWEGVRHVWRNPTLRGLSLSMLCYYAGFGVLTISVPVLLLREHGQDPAVVGLAWSAMAAAGGVAAFLFGARDGVGREGRWLVVAMTLTTAGMLTLLLPGGVPVILGALIVTGFLQGPIDIAMFTLRQRRTAPEWFGRAFAVSVALNSAGSPIAAALAGVVISQSVGGAIVLGAGAFLAGAILARGVAPDARASDVSPDPISADG